MKILAPLSVMIIIIVSPVFLCKNIRIEALFGNMVKYRDCHVEILVFSFHLDN